MTGFDAFWAAWPKNTQTYTRKGCKAECLKRWIARHHESQADQIVKHVEWLKTTADWLKDSGAYIPAPLTYINQQRWDGAEMPEASVEESWLDSYDAAKKAAVKPPAALLKMVRR